MQLDNDTREGKTMALIAYLTIIGFIIALVMNSSKRNSFASFHIRQSLGLILLSFAVQILLNLIDVGIIGTVLYIGLFVLWILGFVAAIQGERKPIPLLGEQFQDWFKAIG